MMRDLHDYNLSSLKADIKLKITLTSYTATKEINVSISNTPVLYVNSNDISLLEGESFKLDAYTRTNDEEPSYANIKFEDYDSKIINVTDEGLITPKNIGETTIVVKHKDANKNKKVVVRVKEKLTKFSISDSSCAKLLGRVYTNDNSIDVYNSCSGFEVCMKGSDLKATISYTGGINPYPFVRVIIDKEQSSFIALDKGNNENEYTLASNLDATKLHTIRVLKATEDSFVQMKMSNVKADEFYTANQPNDLKIDVYGDSITAGYGVLGKPNDYTMTGNLEDGTKSYAYVASEILGADINVMAYQGVSIAVEGWIKDFTISSIYKQYSRSNNSLWNFNDNQPDIIVMYLGTNDSYGLTLKEKNIDDFIRIYKQTIEGLKALCPDSQFILCSGLMLMKDCETEEVSNAIKSIADSYDYTHYIKFDKTTHLGAVGHPGVEDNRKAGEELAKLIESLID